MYIQLFTGNSVETWTQKCCKMNNLTFLHMWLTVC